MTSGTVHHYYARYLDHPSGVTDSLVNWARALRDAGIAVDVLSARPSSKSAGNEFADPDLTRQIPHLGKTRASWIPIGLFRRLRDGDVLVLHEGWVIGNVVAATIARVRSVPYIVVPHGVYEPGIVNATRDPGGLRAWMERVVLRSAAAVHVFYPGEEEVVRQFAPGVEKFITRPNGAPEAAEDWLGDGDYFLWIGRFDPLHKGLDNLVAAWARLDAPRPRLILAGPDFRGGRDLVRRQIEERGLTGTIEIKGRVTGMEKESLIRGARAYVHPSRWESCSIMLLEMLAAGVPSLISSSIHAAQELDPIALRSADFTSHGPGISAALAEVDRSRVLGRAARLWVENEGSWSIVGPKYAADVARIQQNGGPA